MKSLKLNRQIIIGTTILLGLFIFVIGSLIFTPGKPETLRPWIGSVPPGSSRPTVIGHNLFIVGQPAESAFASKKLKGANLLITVAAGQFRRIRVVLDENHKVERITDLNGAFSFDELQMPVDTVNDFVEMAHVRYPMTTDLIQFVLGQPIAFDLALNPKREVLIFNFADQNIKPVTHQITFDDHGQVAKIDDGSRERLELAGADISEVKLNGQLQEEFFLLGTDLLGRDLLIRLTYGVMISLMIGFVATAVSLVIGVFYGALAGYTGGKLDRVMMSGVDIMYGLPFMFLVIILLVNFGSNLIMLFVALGCVQWLTMSRIVRSGVLTIKNREFVQAALVSGASPFSIIFTHILPNLWGTIVVYATMTVPAVIMEESFLSFIGLSVQFNQRPLDSLGTLVSQGMNALGHGGERMWLLLAPSTVMVLLLLALNLLGDGLRDWLDPKLKK